MQAVRENGVILIGDCNSSTPDKCYVSYKSFQNLRNFVTEQNAFSDEVNLVFSYGKRNSIEYIYVKNYVGVIETADGCSIEILPKLYLPEVKVENSIINETRRIFLRMLRHLKDSPFKNIDLAHITTQHFPILEVFISCFLHEFEVLLKKGLKQSYVNIEENAYFCKGKFKITENQKFNFVNKARFFISYDLFSYNIPQNRLIKSTLQLLRGKSKSSGNIRRILDFLSLLDDIPFSSNYNKDFADSANQDRSFSQYSQILNWARVFLGNNSFTNFKGKYLNNAILFPMEKIFEDYIAHIFLRYATFEKLEINIHKLFLVEDHSGKSKFRLYPDIIGYKKDVVKIFDTKWKIIDQGKPSKNYNISQPDMYQLYAYGKKYQEKSQVSVFLLYPMTEKFKKPLSDFVFEANSKLILKAIPIDLTQPGDKIYSELNGAIQLKVS